MLLKLKYENMAMAMGGLKLGIRCRNRCQLFEKLYFGMILGANFLYALKDENGLLKLQSVGGSCKRLLNDIIQIPR